MRSECGVISVSLMSVLFLPSTEESPKGVPDGFRRWLGNNLTDDDFIKGVRLAAGPAGNVIVDEEFFPGLPMGTTTWWTKEPEVCFPAVGTTICTSLGKGSASFDPRVPDNMVVVEPQIGYEQQKFLVFQTMLYLPSNQRVQWADQLQLWQRSKGKHSITT